MVNAGLIYEQIAKLLYIRDIASTLKKKSLLFLRQTLSQAAPVLFRMPAHSSFFRAKDTVVFHSEGREALQGTPLLAFPSRLPRLCTVLQGQIPLASLLKADWRNLVIPLEYIMSSALQTQTQGPVWKAQRSVGRERPSGKAEGTQPAWHSDP